MTGPHLRPVSHPTPSPSSQWSEVVNTTQTKDGTGRDRKDREEEETDVRNEVRV